MRKNFLRFVIFFSFFLMLSNAHSNDSFETADGIAIGSIATSSITTIGDVDFYEFVVSSTSTFYFFSRGQTTDVQGTLFDANQQSLESSSDGGEGFNFRIVRILSPGTYFLRVSGQSAFSTVGDYSIHIEGPGQATLTDEDGFSPWSASDITVGQVASSEINQAGDIDYFEFTVTNTATYYIFSTGITDVQGQLLNANLDDLGTSSNAGEVDNFRIVATLSPGTYFLRVAGQSAFSTFGDYNVHIEGPGQATQTDEDGFSPWSASDITVGQVASSEINQAGDIDYFEFTVTNTATYYIFSTGITDVQGQLLSANLDDLGASSNAGEVDNFRIVATLSPGTYFLRVAGQSAFSTFGDYNVHIEGPGQATQTDANGFSPWSASDINIGQIENGVLELTGDRDYFRFAVQSTARYVVFSRGITDTQANLLNDDLQPLGSSSNAGEGDNFRIVETLTPGIYFLEVSGQSTFSTIGSYAVHVEGPRQATISDDHGFSPWSAFPVSVPSNTNGQLELTGDIDFFAFEVLATSEVQIFTTGITDTSGVLYNADFTSVESNSNSGIDDNFLIETTLSPGVYHIAVSGQSSFSTIGDYVVSIRGLSSGPPVIGTIPRPEPVITPILPLLLILE